MGQVYTHTHTHTYTHTHTHTHTQSGSLTHKRTHTHTHTNGLAHDNAKQSVCLEYVGRICAPVWSTCTPVFVAVMPSRSKYLAPGMRRALNSAFQSRAAGHNHGWQSLCTSACGWLHGIARGSFSPAVEAYACSPCTGMYQDPSSTFTLGWPSLQAGYVAAPTGYCVEAYCACYTRARCARHSVRGAANQRIEPAGDPAQGGLAHARSAS